MPVELPVDSAAFVVRTLLGHAEFVGHDFLHHPRGKFMRAPPFRIRSSKGGIDIFLCGKICILGYLRIVYLVKICASCKEDSRTEYI